MHATNQLSYDAILTLFFQQNKTMFFESALLQITASSVPACYITFWPYIEIQKNNTSIGETCNEYVDSIWFFKCIIYTYSIWCTNSSTSITYHLPSNNQRSKRRHPIPLSFPNSCGQLLWLRLANWICKVILYTKTTSTGGAKTQ